jgi:uncharacterized membrane protein
MAAKTATYSAMHMAVAIAVAWAISGDWRVALGIGLIEPLVQTVAYTIHERVWSQIGTGRRQPRNDGPGRGEFHGPGCGHDRVLVGAGIAP